MNTLEAEPMVQVQHFWAWSTPNLGMNVPPTSSILTLNCKAANSEDKEDEEDLSTKTLTYGIIIITKYIADFINQITTVKQQQGCGPPPGGGILMTPHSNNAFTMHLRQE